MSEPDNQTSGRYYLRASKPTPFSPTAHTSLSDATITSPLPIISAPTSLFRSLSPAPPAQSDTSSTPQSPTQDATGHFSDSDDMASSSNSPLPAAWTGRPHEDVLEFLKNFELWTFRGLNEASKLSALPLLLKDSAAIWYNTQSQDTRSDFGSLKAALQTRYGPSITDAWKRAAELWQMKQLPH